MQQKTERILLYIGSANRDLQRLPEEIKEEFQGIATPKQDVWLIEERFKRAEGDYKERFKENEKEKNQKN